MIRINQLKLPISHTEKELEEKLAKLLRVSADRLTNYHIVKQSLDARKKPELFYSYTVDVKLKDEKNVVHKAKNKNVAIIEEKTYCFPKAGKRGMKHRPVIVGTGPAGLFCGLMLARAGLNPLLLERGCDVDTRLRQTENFWAGKGLDPDSNVQFGEGGAGTFSDGKLNTLVKDVSGRNRKVLETFVEFGADPRILYQSKPHIGTDVLSGIVKAMRQEIIALGGEVRFRSKVTDLHMEHGCLRAVSVGDEVIETEVLVLAIGHSARDTFELLWKKQIPMEQKAFAVGLRVQHPQSMINLSQYGMEDPGELGAASYKLTYQSSNGRGVYSFCMCPGGYVVNASSEQGRLAVNGMSYENRGGENSNSAIIVTVGTEDFPDQTPLGGVRFQQRLEELAFLQGNGKIPLQLYGDFKAGIPSVSLGEVTPQVKGQYQLTDLRPVFSGALADSFIEGMEYFGQVIGGFHRPDCILAGVESRTSSPVRIPRDEGLESSVRGLFPCGEGAGYAGGITSAAMDGIRVAEEIVKRTQETEKR